MRMSSAINGVKKWFSSSSVNGPSPGHSNFRVYSDGASDLFPYTRPCILGLSKEAAKASADHEIRPILLAHIDLPLNAGYSETINAGKTLHVNEDQAFAEMFCLNVINVDEEKGEQTISKLPYSCFGIFDGHAGPGAALAAVNQLQDIIHEKLQEIQDLILDEDGKPCKKSLLREAVAAGITFDSLVIGVLEQSFLEMDSRIKKDKHHHVITGGCTAVVALLIRSKLFVANAGDSRAVLSKNGEPIPMSSDHTPETDRNRLQILAFMRPNILGTEFTRFEYQQKPRRKHIGKKLLCRDRNMTGWALKLINEEDVSKTQMICGSGKSARLLETIGTTRGFGDFELRASYTNIPVKPFLTPEPEVKVYDFASDNVTENDVLIMATDGLWEKVPNEKACSIVQETLSQCDITDKRRYAVTAQNLVMAARGRNTAHGWRIAKTSQDNFSDTDLRSSDPASYDDISVFVIPVGNYRENSEVVHYPLTSECNEEKKELSENKMDTFLNTEENNTDTFLNTEENNTDTFLNTEEEETIPNDTAESSQTMLLTDVASSNYFDGHDS